MKKFLVLYYSPQEAMAKMATATPEEMKAGEKAWMDWFKGLGDNLAEMGEYFKQGTSFTANGSTDSTGKVTGYSIVQAESFDAAKELVKNHPHLEWFEGCSLEIYEPQAMGK